MPPITVNDEAHWHELRRRHVGSSDVACLLGVSKRKTRWSMWMEKTGKLPALDLSEVTHIRNGKHFEPAIASIGAEKFQVQLRKVKRYIECDDCPALGVSVDYEEYGSGSLCPVEIKWSTVGNGWDWDGDVITEAPDEYLIQVQAQLACMPRAPYARLWGFVQNDVREMIVAPRPRIIARIKEVCTEFMSSVLAGIEPPIDFSLDGDAISRLAFLRPMVSVDLKDNHRATILAKEYMQAKEDEAVAEKVKKAAQAELVKMMLDAAGDAAKDDQKIVGTMDGYKMTIATVAENPGTVITSEMVGQVINARKGYRRPMIKELKDGPEA